MLSRTCENCGVGFETKDNRKRFCTIKCFVHSSCFRDAVAARKKRKDKIEIKCVGCETILPCRVALSRGRIRWCSSACRRAYWAVVFDSMVANRDEIPFPQSFDEFLDRVELNCLFPGCEWKGRALSIHVYNYHGISADRFKELAGFNRTTGLVGKETSELLSSSCVWKGKILSDDARAEKRKVLAEVCEHGNRTVRPEGREHMVKAKAYQKIKGS